MSFQRRREFGGASIEGQKEAKDEAYNTFIGDASRSRRRGRAFQTTSDSSKTASSDSDSDSDSEESDSSEGLDSRDGEGEEEDEDDGKRRRTWLQTNPKKTLIRGETQMPTSFAPLRLFAFQSVIFYFVFIRPCYWP